ACTLISHWPCMLRSAVTANIFVLQLGFGFLCRNATVPSEFYTLSLHDALPISVCYSPAASRGAARHQSYSSINHRAAAPAPDRRSEEHTSELQSRENLVCRLLLEKKKCDADRFQLFLWGVHCFVKPYSVLRTRT